MGQDRLYDKPSFLLQKLLDVFIRNLRTRRSENPAQHLWPSYLDMLTSKIGDFLGKLSRLIDRARWHLVRSNDTVGDGNAMILVTKRRCLMHDACPAIASDVLVNDHTESPIFVL